MSDVFFPANAPCSESPPPRRFGGLRDVVQDNPLRFRSPEIPGKEPEVRAAGVARLGELPPPSIAGCARRENMLRM